MITLNELSKLEKEILNLMTNDVRVKGIGAILGKSTSTVEKTLFDLRLNFGVETNHGLMVEYFHVQPTE